ncbi:MAG: class I SAM-dependent methyltransferase family protein [Promethearchaeota archaeon]
MIWSVDSIKGEQTILGVGVPLETAEMVRLRLINSNILIRYKKPFKSEGFVFFPITDSRPIPELLRDISFKFQQSYFTSRSEQESITTTLRKEFPNVNLEELSIKFDQLGEIAILKLNPASSSLFFRKRVGELILSHSKRIKAVLNKSDAVEGTKRVYPTEHLAGEKIWQSWHQEYGVMIFIDLRAYFNPRLAEEHHRVAMSVNPGEKILDLFTGVGSFALHCAKSALSNTVAIDINPYAIYALQRSIRRNKLRGTIYPIIGDSRNILRLQGLFDRVIINLPQQAVNFLPYAIRLLKKGGVINFYQFISKMENPEKQFQKLLAKKLVNINSYKELYFKVGREISPSRAQVNVDIQIN